MKLYQFEKSQVLPMELNEAWAFFSDPRNLAKITPPELNLVPSSSVPDHMYAGMVVTYKVKLAPLVYTTWVTEITQVKAPSYFVDEQRFGPYKFWHHQHHFKACNQGVLAEDVIHYGLYGGVLGAVVNALMVKRQLERIFAFRKKILADMFNTATP